MSKKDGWKYDLYFPHKAGSRNDPKLLKVLAKHKHGGVGLYWSLLEILRESKDTEFKYPVDSLEELAIQLHISIEELEPVLDTFVKVQLLKREKGFLYSPGLIENMNFMKQKSEKARASVKERWDKVKNKRNTNVQPTKDGRTTDGIQVKNSIVNPSKEGLSILDNSPVSNPAEPAPEILLRDLVSGWPEECDRENLIKKIEAYDQDTREAMVRDLQHDDFGVKEIKAIGLEKWVNGFEL